MDESLERPPQKGVVADDLDMDLADVSAVVRCRIEDPSWQVLLLEGEVFVIGVDDDAESVVGVENWECLGGELVVCGQDGIGDSFVII